MQMFSFIHAKLTEIWIHQQTKKSSVISDTLICNYTNNTKIFPSYPYILLTIYTQTDEG